MKKFVAYEKMSKKQKREIDRQRRGTWGISPVTRIAETDKKHYSRKVKHKNSGGDSSLPLYHFPQFTLNLHAECGAGRAALSVFASDSAAAASTAMRCPVCRRS